MPGEPQVLVGTMLGSYSRAETWHRSEGLWAFDTANPDGWERGIEFINGSSADFVMLQETPPPRGGRRGGAEDVGRAFRGGD